MTVDDPAPNHAQRDQHHLHCVRDHVSRRAVVLEPIDADGRHRVGRSFVKADGEVEFLGHHPERLVHRVADHLLAVIRVGPQEPAAHLELLAGVAHLVDRQLDRLHRQHRDPEEALGIRLAVIGEPAVVGAAHRGGKAGILDGAREQAETGIEEGGIDAVGIHVDDARVWVEPAPAPLGIFEGAGLDDALPGADGPQAADPPRIAQQLTLDAEALLAVVVDDKPRPPLAEFGIDVLVPQVERLEDVTVRVDYVVRARHLQSLRRQSNRCNTTVAAPGSRASTLQLHHAHPEHGLATDVDVVLAYEGELAVVADAEDRQTGRDGPDRVAVSHVHRKIVLGHQYASTWIDVERAWMDGTGLDVLDRDRLAAG